MEPVRRVRSIHIGRDRAGRHRGQLRWRGYTLLHHCSWMRVIERQLPGHSFGFRESLQFDICIFESLSFARILEIPVVCCPSGWFHSVPEMEQPSPQTDLSIPTSFAALDVDVRNRDRFYFPFVALEPGNVVGIACCCKTEVNLLLPLFKTMWISLQCHCSSRY